jgi:hypothetical protein
MASSIDVGELLAFRPSSSTTLEVFATMSKLESAATYCFKFGAQTDPDEEESPRKDPYRLQDSRL